MPLELEERDDLTSPSEQDQILARESSSQLAAHLSSEGEAQIQIVAGDGTTEVLRVPVRALRMFTRMLKEMADGNAVTVIPIFAELTTQQAADLLGVSRPYLIRLVENKEIPYHSVGTHRRIYFKDLMLYKNRKREEQRQALRELAEQAQEWDME